jgi:putative DNA primase/helicase
MRQDFFTFTPQFKLVIAGNHKPDLRNVDEAMRRRLHLVPFDVTVPSDERDPDLPEKLKAELPGILAWAIEGCRLYRERRLDPPKAVRDVTDAYFAAEDTFAAWIDECCDVAPNRWEKPTVLFKSWTDYANASGYVAGSQKTFAAALESRGYQRGKDGTRGRYWSGIAPRSNASR